MSEDDLITFLQLEYGRVGADTHLTPREVIRDFVELLDILYQTPSLSIEDVLGTGQLPSQTAAAGTDDASGSTASMFAEFDI